MLFVACILAMLFSFLSGSSALIVVTACISIAIAALYFCDLCAVQKALRGLHCSDAEQRREVFRGSLAQPLTATGRDARRQLDAIVYRSGVQQWELEQQRARMRLHRLGGAIVGESEAPAFDGSDPQELVTHVLEHMQTRFRARCVAVISADANDRTSVTTHLRGAVASCTRSYIESFLRPYLHGQPSSVVGYVSHIDVPSFFADFSAIGIYHTLTEPVQVPGMDEKFVLWWGFGGVPPTSEEVERARELRDLMGERLKVVNVVQGLSQKAQSAEDLGQRREQYLAQVSHDIRSPIHNVCSVLSLMRTEVARESDGELIDVALSNCRSVSEIVEDVLDYARHEGGFLTAHPREIELNELVMTTVSAFKIAAKTKGIELHCIPLDDHAFVRFDGRHLRRILSNLISNALKYTERGRVTVSVIRRDEELQVKVADTGRGMTGEEVGRLFQPYVRLAPYSTEGNGLGLVVTKLLATANGADVTVESRAGEGSVFALRFLATQDSGSQAPVPVVLVVDDDSDTLRIMRIVLERSGFAVFATASAEEAMHHVDESLTALVLDKSVSGSLALAERCRDRFPATARILCTGDVRLDQKWRSAVECVIEKPVDGEQLISLIRERAALQRKAA